MIQMQMQILNENAAHFEGKYNSISLACRSKHFQQLNFACTFILEFMNILCKFQYAENSMEVHENGNYKQGLFFIHETQFL